MITYCFYCDTKTKHRRYCPAIRTTYKVPQIRIELKGESDAITLNDIKE